MTSVFAFKSCVLSILAVHEVHVNHLTIHVKKIFTLMSHNFYCSLGSVSWQRPLPTFINRAQAYSALVASACHHTNGIQNMFLLHVSFSLSLFTYVLNTPWAY